MKLAPSILQPPSIKSGSLYFYKGIQIQPGSSDAEAAEVYFRRVTVAKAMTRKLSMHSSCTRWQRNPKPCVLKSKRAVKWDSLNNVWTPHQRVDMDLAKKIWELDVWKWKCKRISDGSSLRTGFLLTLCEISFSCQQSCGIFVSCQQVCGFAAFVSM